MHFKHDVTILHAPVPMHGHHTEGAETTSVVGEGHAVLGRRVQVGISAVFQQQTGHLLVTWITV